VCLVFLYDVRTTHHFESIFEELRGSSIGAVRATRAARHVVVVMYVKVFYKKPELAVHE